MLTTEFLLDAIFSAKRLEQLQADVRDEMIRHLMGAKPIESNSVSESLPTAEVGGSNQFPGS